MRRVLVFALLIALVSAAGAMGKAVLDRPGDEPARVVPVERANPSGWAREAGRICRSFFADVSAFATGQDGVAPEIVLARLISANKQWNDELIALEPPSDGKRLVERLHLLLRKDEQLLMRMLGALQANDTKHLSRVVQEYETLGLQQQELFRALGAKDCVQTRASALRV